LTVVLDVRGVSFDENEVMGLFGASVKGREQAVRALEEEPPGLSPLGGATART